MLQKSFRSTNDKDELMLSEEQTLYIKQSYISQFLDKACFAKATINDVKIDGYYGIYNECIAVYMSDNYHGYAGLVWQESIGGIKLEYFDSRSILILKERRFCKIKQAYNEKMLKVEDLRNIALIHNNKKGF